MPSLLQSIRDQINCRLILVAIADKYAHGNGRLTLEFTGLARLYAQGPVE